MGLKQGENSREHRFYGARVHTNQERDLLRGFNDGLRFRVIANQEKMSMTWRHRLRRVGRADDRECLRDERKREQDAEDQRLHIAVLLCIICAIEIPNST